VNRKTNEINELPTPPPRQCWVCVPPVIALKTRGPRFALPDIAIVSMRGRERSVLLGTDTLGSWSLSRFTGQFDEGSMPIWTRGQLLIESVRRFKGQAAAAVVLTECDIAELDSLNRRLLFVGLTRARVHLEWVISGDTARLLEDALG
jgi:superfamily I DNA and RNA helicase